jgi:hypothetical protein
LRLEVHVHNSAAISRYRKSGYRLFGLRHDYYDDGADALRFEKPLAGSSTGGKFPLHLARQLHEDAASSEFATPDSPARTSCDPSVSNLSTSFDPRRNS